MPRNYSTQFFSWTCFSFVVRFSYKTSLLHQLAMTLKIRSKEKYRTKIYFYKFWLSYIIIALRNIWIARIFDCIFLRIIISKLKSSGNKKLKGRNQKKTNCLKKLLNKSSGKKILNTTFYPDQKGINKFIKGKSELKGNKQVKTKNLKLENAKNIVRMTKRLCDHLCYS